MFSGDALVCGDSIASAGGMDRVRPLMGFCPQFDVLWEQLTGEEHLLLFAAIKGGWGGWHWQGCCFRRGGCLAAGGTGVPPPRCEDMPVKTRVAPALLLALQACRPASGGVTPPGCWRM